VQNDASYEYGTKTGNYCETRWWAWLLIAFAIIFLLGLIIGLIMYFCCKKKEKPMEMKPLVSKPKPAPVVEVQAKAPPRQEVIVRHQPAPPRQEVIVRHQPVERVEYRTDYHRGDVKEWREEPRVKEYVTELYEPKVLVETRTYSPNKEVQRHEVAHPDWGSYSQAHWREH
jgi:hypothetical protein